MHLGIARSFDCGGLFINNFPSSRTAPPLRMLCAGFGIFLRNISF